MSVAPGAPKKINPRKGRYCNIILENQRPNPELIKDYILNVLSKSHTKIPRMLLDSLSGSDAIRIIKKMCEEIMETDDDERKHIIEHWTEYLEDLDDEQATTLTEEQIADIIKIIKEHPGDSEIPDISTSLSFGYKGGKRRKTRRKRKTKRRKRRKTRRKRKKRKSRKLKKRN